MAGLVVPPTPLRSTPLARLVSGRAILLSAPGSGPSRGYHNTSSGPHLATPTTLLKAHYSRTVSICTITGCGWKSYNTASSGISDAGTNMSSKKSNRTILSVSDSEAFGKDGRNQLTVYAGLSTTSNPALQHLSLERTKHNYPKLHCKD
jgi:hypothetical protein